jgi:hypothetical protein
MNYDEYGDVINGPETYKGIAEELSGRPVIIGWSDGVATHFDILFSLKPLQYGMLQGGVGKNDLFVSIMRWGSFGFDPIAVDTHPGYYEEKLGKGMGDTAIKLGELINNVKKLI